MEKIKIYFDGVLYSWINTGGVVRYFDELIKNFGTNIEATMLFHYPHLPVSLPKNINATNLLTTSPERVKLAYKAQRMAFKYVNRFLLERHFSKITEGVFHSTYYTTYKRLHIPQVVTVHDMTYEKFPNFFNSAGARRFIREKEKSIRAADQIICISETTKEDVMKYYNLPAHNMHVVYHGVSTKFRVTPRSEKCTLDMDKPFILFVGKRDGYKNFSQLLTAFAGWQGNQSHTLVVAGDAWSQSEVEQIDASGMTGKIKNVGYVSDTDLVSLYNNAEVFVYTSRYEGFGLPLLEAAACHTPVIAADIPVFKEIASEWATFFVLDDVDSLIDALDTFPRRDHQSIDFNFLKKYSWEQTAEQTENVYREAVANYKYPPL